MLLCIEWLRSLIGYVCVDVNGKTIHVVQRSPPSARAATATNVSGSGAEAGEARAERPSLDGSSFVVGSFSIPPDATDVNQVHVSMFITQTSLHVLVLKKLILKFTEYFIVVIFFCFIYC